MIGQAVLLDFMGDIPFLQQVSDVPGFENLYLRLNIVVIAVIRRLSGNGCCGAQGSVRIEDSGMHVNKVSVELIKEAASEAELNSIYLTQLLHHVDESVILTLTVVCTSDHCITIRPILMVCRVVSSVRENV